jgi:hypothetical protein
MKLFRTKVMNRTLFILAKDQEEASEKTTLWIDSNYDGWQATALVNRQSTPAEIENCDVISFSEPIINCSYMQGELDERKERFIV